MGLYFLDRNYSEKELNTLIKKGINEEKVIKIFGKPSYKLKHKDGTTSQLSYMVAPERQPITEETTHPDGFTVMFEGDKVFRWGFNYSNMTRKKKPQFKERSKLKISIPLPDLTANDFDWEEYLHSISVPDTTQKLNKRDGISLISILQSINAVNLDRKPPIQIKDECDLFLLLESNFPELAQFKEQNKDSGKENMGLKELTEILMPYLIGKKKLPRWK